MKSYEIDRMVEGHRDEIINFIADLVKIPTVNTPPTGNELPGQLFFERSCVSAGLLVHKVFPSDIEGYRDREDFLKDRSFEDRYNVIGIWKGNKKGRSLLLSGHMDVVPEEPLPWTVCKPFEPVIADGKIYGRGSADMKSGLGAAFMAVKLLKETGFAPSGDVLIESVADEEFAGSHGTIASRIKGYNADFAINPEPTGLILFPSCVGALILKITVKGTSGMPYTGKEIYNPVFGIVKIIEILDRYEKYRNGSEQVHDLWKDTPYKRSVIISKLKAGETKEHGQLGIPIDAWIEAIIQTFPGETEKSSMDALTDFIDKNIDGMPELQSNRPVIEKEYRYVDPSECGLEHKGIKAFRKSYKEITGEEPDIMGAPFSSDLGAFQKYGNTPAVLFGPTGGNLHAPNEWADIESIMTAAKVYAEMIINWCG